MTPPATPRTAHSDLWWWLRGAGTRRMFARALGGSDKPNDTYLRMATTVLDKVATEIEQKPWAGATVAEAAPGLQAWFERYLLYGRDGDVLPTYAEMLLTPHYQHIAPCRGEPCSCHHFEDLAVVRAALAASPSAAPTNEDEYRLNHPYAADDEGFCITCGIYRALPHPHPASAMKLPAEPAPTPRRLRGFIESVATTSNDPHLAHEAQRILIRLDDPERAALAASEAKEEAL